MKTTERILIAGSGGQGIIISGKVLASAGIDSYEHVTFFPSYGAEVRGGMCNCQTILSNQEIASPIADQYDSMIILNQDGYDAFSNKINSCELVIINSSLCKSGKHKKSIIPIAATEMADILGNTHFANFIMLGTYINHSAIINKDKIIDSINGNMANKSEDVRRLNIQAFNTGLTA